VNLKWYYLEE